VIPSLEATPAEQPPATVGPEPAVAGVHLMDLAAATPAAVDEVAAFLPLCFARWRYLQEPWAARREVIGSLDARRISRIAVGPDGRVAGWCGGLPEYDGRVWELHPMAVRPDRQRRGIGRLLLADFEARVRARGGRTIVLATDDVDGATSAWGVDLYPDLWRHLRDLTTYADHPVAFYRKCGYVVHGLVPDANGWGRPGILMAKRVAVSEASASASTGS
jgi:aminoglycoside 6'-N-acetyltransferase I